METEDTVTFLPEPFESRRGGMIVPVSFGGLHAC
jgi:hypothetical protein